MWRIQRDAMFVELCGRRLKLLCEMCVDKNKTKKFVSEERRGFSLGQKYA